MRTDHSVVGMYQPRMQSIVAVHSCFGTDQVSMIDIYLHQWWRKMYRGYMVHMLLLLGSAANILYHTVCMTDYHSLHCMNQLHMFCMFVDQHYQDSSQQYS